MTEAGRIVGGKFRLVEKIGEGGMAEIWRAVHQTLNRDVAVKFLTVHGRRAADLREQFLREARIMAAIRHRNVVNVLDFGPTEDGAAYMVMEFLEGETLGERLSHTPPLKAEEVIHVAAGLLGGLAAVHDAGIVHRDIKPANIFLVRDADGMFPKLIDFGVSRIFDPESILTDSVLPTQDGLLVGTPEYMSVEQARGLADIDNRTDLYSVGVIMYEALTGTLPYSAEHTGDLLMMVTLGGAPPLRDFRPDLGDRLSDFLEHAMHGLREKRFQDAREMRRALLAVAEQIGSDGLNGTAQTAVRRTDSKRPTAEPPPRGRQDLVETEPPPPAQPLARTESDSTGPVSDAPAAFPPRRSRAVWIALVAAVLIAGTASALLLGNGDAAEARPQAVQSPPASAPTSPEPPRTAEGDAPEEASRETASQAEPDAGAQPPGSDLEASAEESAADVPESAAEPGVEDAEASSPRPGTARARRQRSATMRRRAPPSMGAVIRELDF